MKCKTCGSTRLELVQIGEFQHELEFTVEDDGRIKVHDEKPPVSESYEIHSTELCCRECGNADWDIELV